MALMGCFTSLGNNEITISVNDAEKCSDLIHKKLSEILKKQKLTLSKIEYKRQELRQCLIIYGFDGLFQLHRQ
jgi:hypothetical protein